MFKETVSYEDYDGNQRTEDFYFNLTKPELLELNFENAGGLEKYLKKIVDSNNNKEIISTFKKIVLMAYGEKSDDGRRFIKSDEMKKEFEQSAAYPEIFMKYATDANAAAKFVNGVFPKDMAGQLKDTPATIAAANGK